ncbi:MAG: transposase [Bryobacter sp.]|nr:transposase [Bryobacter sp. CoA8 C33]
MTACSSRPCRTRSPATLPAPGVRVPAATHRAAAPSSRGATPAAPPPRARRPAPPQINANGAKQQDGRALRRYRGRWKVERLFAWLQHFRRLVTRWEYHAENFLGFVRLGCLKLLLRYL